MCRTVCMGVCQSKSVLGSKLCVNNYLTDAGVAVLHSTTRSSPRQPRLHRHVDDGWLHLHVDRPTAILSVTS